MIRKTKARTQLIAEDVERLHSKYSTARSASGCWLWTAGKSPLGYGKIAWPTPTGIRPVTAHRAMWHVEHGHLPPSNIGVLHKCDTPACVNPSHLFLGTQRDNMLDMTLKGRRIRGEASKKAKLTSAQVAEIRKTYRRNDPTCNQAALARKFGVTFQSISKIILRKRWTAESLGGVPS